MSQIRDVAGRDSGAIQPNSIAIRGDRIAPRQFRIEILQCRITISPDGNAISS